MVFLGYGSHTNQYPFAYITVAAAIGIEKTEVDMFMKRLDKTLEKFTKKRLKNTSGTSPMVDQQGDNG